MRSLLPLLYLFSVWTEGTGASDPDLPFMDYLDNNHLVCLKWGFDNLQGNITLKFIVNTTGWVGFGFSPKGDMVGADILIGGVGPSGSYFSDRHATGKFMPLVDEEQSYTLLSLAETDGQTIMTVERTIQSCDDKDFHITAQPIKVIYAYGVTDDIAYHGSRRGTKELNLLNYMPRTTSTNPTYLSATVDNITVPEKHTYYHCKVMKFPNLDANAIYHVYQIEAVIENIDLVHHMLLYSCPSFVTEPYEGECYKGNKGDACHGVVAVWGVGAGVFELPENVGIPVGGANSDKFYRLEIHYNNQNNEADDVILLASPFCDITMLQKKSRDFKLGVSGRTDSSGLWLYYTTQLRMYDAGFLTTGVSPTATYDIPPRAIQFRTYGTCNTTLFSELVNPVPDLQVFAVMLHTHLAGRKIRVALFRNGKHEDFVALDENFNFELQQGVILGKLKTIKPGDEIAVECTYSTTDRTKVTEMGLGTTDEMCLAFLLYYPEIKISECISQPNTKNKNYSMPTTSDQDKIAEMESFLQNLSQTQYASDYEFNFSVNRNGSNRKMMKTPTVTCPNVAGGLASSWTVNAAGIILLLLWIAIM